MTDTHWISNPLLAPSELALLHGEHLAPKGSLLDKTPLLHVDGDVSAKHLARTLLAIAVLANEQASVIRLEARQKSALLGLAKSQALYAEPDGAAPVWPAHSLEAQLPALLAPLCAKKQNEAQTLVHALLQHDVDNPWQTLVERVKAGLAQRGLLQAVVVGKKTQYTLPLSTAELASRQPIAPLQQWLADAERSRPDLFKLLAAQIESGLKRRVSQSTSV